MRSIMWLIQLCFCFTLYVYWLRKITPRYQFKCLDSSDQKTKQSIFEIKDRRRRRRIARENLWNNAI